MEELLKIQNNDSEQLSPLGSEAESISLPYLDLHGNENLEASFLLCNYMDVDKIRLLQLL